MAMDLHDIFPGVCLWRFHQNDEDFINGMTALRIDDLSVMEMMGNKIGLVFPGVKYSFGDGFGKGAAQTNDANATFPERS